MKDIVSASDGNLKRPHLAARHLNTTISFWLRMNNWEKATLAIGKPWYETEFFMNNHFKLMHLPILIRDEGQSKLSSQGAVLLHCIALKFKEQCLHPHIPNALKLMV